MSFHDLILVVIAVVSCALLITAHISIVAALAVRPPRWRALVALVVLPAAPYWAARERLRLRAATWLIAAAVYAVARVFAR